ncbi:MAG: helix-turn-helix domain-containing protein [Bacteroidota bacterium]
MAINKRNIRLIFGLKVRQYRLEKSLSFKELSAKSGLSVSYLNEIEKGKKYPKSEKIIQIADALDVSYDQLVSLKLSKKMAPVAELLNSGILDDLPLSIFGLETNTLLELITDVPTKINAFISTIIKIARNYEMSREHFYLAALRSYQEMHDNYFEELEEAVASFTEEFEFDHTPPVSTEQITNILQNTYGYTIDHTGLLQYPDLSSIRSLYLPDSRYLFINNDLTPIQKAFQFGKELAFNYLKLKERPSPHSHGKLNSFEEALNNFKASYFSVALLINREEMKNDLEDFFQLEAWDSDRFLSLMNKYEATPEMFFHRLTNLLPTYFGVNNLFFLRTGQQLDVAPEFYSITKELHLHRQHSPHSVILNEHYCRRWVSVRILKNLMRGQQLDSQETCLIDIQKSSYVGTKNEYFCFSAARANAPTPNSNVSVTIGIHMDAVAKRKIKFLEHPDIPQKVVHSTCERCTITDCMERAAPPDQLIRDRKIQKAKDQLELLITSRDQILTS